MARLQTNKATHEVVKLAEAMAALVRESGALELKVIHKEHQLSIRRGSGAPMPAAVAPRPHSTSESHADADVDYGTPVSCQHVGIFRPLHPKTEKPLVQVGHTVETNQCLGWVESMGIRHELLAPRAGTIAEILAEPGDPVEFGQILLFIQ